MQARYLTLLALTLMFASPSPGEAQTPPVAGPAGCAPEGDVEFVCGGSTAEDLVPIPGSDWFIASSFRGEGGVRLVDARTRRITTAYPGGAERHDAKTYADCPGPPDAESKAQLVTHGLALGPRRGGRHALYVVHHGKRESIEVFEVDMRRGAPQVAWVGCVVAPDPLYVNSVVALPGGGFLATNYWSRRESRDSEYAKASAGRITGELWEWTPRTGWKKLPGTEESAPNGIVTSPDGKTLYVASWGTQSLSRLTMANGSVKRETVALGFRVDNLRWAPDGAILAAGQIATDGGVRVVKVHPRTLEVTPMITRANTSAFGHGTVANQRGDTLWVGSSRYNRIAIFPIKPGGWSDR